MSSSASNRSRPAGLSRTATMRSALLSGGGDKSLQHPAGVLAHRRVASVCELLYKPDVVGIGAVTAGAGRLVDVARAVHRTVELGDSSVWCLLGIGEGAEHPDLLLLVPDLPLCLGQSPPELALVLVLAGVVTPCAPVLARSSGQSGQAARGGPGPAVALGVVPLGYAQGAQVGEHAIDAGLQPPHGVSCLSY